MRRLSIAVLGTAFVLAAFGCAAGPDPGTTQAPPVAAPATPVTRGLDGLVVGGASDTVGAVPGRADAPYRFRFRQVEPPSDRFTTQDRDLSFYFRPTPDALHFQVENRQNRSVWIEWERCVFYDANGSTDKVAHATTRWEDRFTSQPNTQIAGLQRYSDYVLPMSYLLDPVGSTDQIHRPVLPEDGTSPQYGDRIFGVDLALLVEDRPRVYSFRFKVASVIPR